VTFNECHSAHLIRFLINPAVGYESRWLGSNLGSMAYALVKKLCRLFFDKGSGLTSDNWLLSSHQ
jgi:hypothetical protein